MGTSELSCQAAVPFPRRLTLYREALYRSGQLHEVTIDGHRLAYADIGTGRALFLLHGFSGSLFDWRKMVFPLAERGFRVIVPDMLGAGESSKPADADYSVKAQGGRMARLLDHLRIEKTVLIGNSYGGGVALVVARQRPELVDRMILLDAYCYPDGLPAIAKPVRMPVIPEWFTGIVSLEAAARYLLPLTDEMDPGDVEEYAREVGAEGRSMTIIKTLRSMLSDNLSEWEARLRSTYTSALVLWGGRDRTLPVDLGRRLARDLPQARLAIIEKAGHMPNQETPKEVLQHIDRELGLAC